MYSNEYDARDYERFSGLDAPDEQERASREKQVELQIDRELERRAEGASETFPILDACDVVAEYPIDETVWHQLRAEGIGGSDAGIIMGASRYETPLSLWMLKTGRAEPREGSEATEMGSLLEPFIREHLVADYLVREGYCDGVNVIAPQAMYRSREHDWMLANTDGFLEMDYLTEPETYGLEIKTGRVYQLPKWKDGRVPDSYWWQVQHYMAVTGLQKFVVFGVIGNQRIVRIVERDEEAIERLIVAEADFWERVERNDPLWAPLPTGSDRDMDALLELCSPQTDDVADLSDVEKLIRYYAELAEHQNALKEQREWAKQRIIAAMGSAKYGQVGELQVTFSRYKTTRLDSKRLKDERPEIAAEYEIESESGRLSVKEAS